MSEQSTSWKWPDYSYLHRHYPSDGAKKVSVQLGKSLSNVENKAEKLNLNEQVPFSEEELKTASTYGKTLGTALIFLLPHRTQYEVKELLECVKKH